MCVTGLKRSCAQTILSKHLFQNPRSNTGQLIGLKKATTQQALVCLKSETKKALENKKINILQKRPRPPNMEAWPVQKLREKTY